MLKINIGFYRSGFILNWVIWWIDCVLKFLFFRYYGGFLFFLFDGILVRLIVIKVFFFDSCYGLGCVESEIYGDIGV